MRSPTLAELMSGAVTSRPSSPAYAPPIGAKEAATMLAHLMEKQLGWVEGRIDPVALRLFLQAYWTRVTALAHTIHEDQ